MIPSTVAEITEKIKKNWSPEQISGWLKKRPEIPISVSHETIYKFIWVDKKKAGKLYTFLIRKAKKYNARCKDKQAGRGFIKDRVGIEDRPPIINERGRVGDWEIDLVIRERPQRRASYYCRKGDSLHCDSLINRHVQLLMQPLLS